MNMFRINLEANYGAFTKYGNDYAISQPQGRRGHNFAVHLQHHFLILYNMQQEENPVDTGTAPAPEQQQEDTAMYQSRRQAQAQPETEDPNDTFLSQFKQSPSFFFL